ncbi:MAG: hypothetical protein HYS20_00285 [Rhodocyclales bacterium]|nr:hypothetical protein [Rhodocyclales bacterium]
MSRVASFLLSFALGALLGLIGCAATLYLSGMLFDAFGIRLYESEYEEYEQQRNFNVFLLVSAVVAGVSGYVCLKMHRNRAVPKK